MYYIWISINHFKLNIMAETIDYNGKKVPLTKDGFPSLVYLPKEDRALVTEAKANMKGLDTKKRQEELKRFLDGLKKK